jgi:hypothetical protein
MSRLSTKIKHYKHISCLLLKNQKLDFAKNEIDEIVDSVHNNHLTLHLIIAHIPPLLY